jgi:hypothetical protein
MGMHLLDRVVHRTLPIEIQEEREQFLLSIDELRQLVEVAVLEDSLQLGVTVVNGEVVEQVLVVVAQNWSEDSSQLVVGHRDRALNQTLANHSVPDVQLVSVAQLEHLLFCERLGIMQVGAFENLVWVVDGYRQVLR